MTNGLEYVIIRSKSLNKITILFNGKTPKGENEMTVLLTQHANERMKTRTNFSPTRAQEIAEKALWCGKDPSDFPKNTRRYLENVLRRSAEGDGADTLKVLGNDSYLFCKGVLITIIPIPEKVRKADQKK